MLAPKPPVSVARTRAVPEMIVAVKQVATIAPGHLLEIAPLAAPTPAPAADPPLSRPGDDTPV